MKKKILFTKLNEIIKSHAKSAFSLVELMISLITISLITAAMAPVITKKIKSSTVTVGAGEVMMSCSHFGEDCSLCYEDKCIVCSKTCAENEALDIANCSCVACSDKHGASCLKCDIKNCLECTNTNYIVNGVCTSCEDGYYGDGITETTCPQGYYCSEGIKTPCPAGTYNDETGKSTLSDCKACVNGTYSMDGATSCTTSTSVSNCATYSTTSNACAGCNSGYHISGSSCVSDCVCSNGSCGSGSSVCTTCNAGYYLSSGSCITCEAGSYCPGDGSKSTCNGSVWSGFQHSGSGAASCSSCRYKSGFSPDGTGTYTCQLVYNNKSYCWCKTCLGGYYVGGDGTCNQL